MTDLASTIKTGQDKLVVAGFVRGSGSHIAWEMFMHAADLPATSINWVPYDSVGDGVTAVLGGHGAVTIAYVDLVKDYVTAGQLRVIGVMADKRLAELHDVPTLKEQGIDVADRLGAVARRDRPEEHAGRGQAEARRRDPEGA